MNRSFSSASMFIEVGTIWLAILQVYISQDKKRGVLSDQEVSRSSEIECSVLVLAINAVGNFNLFHCYHKGEKQVSRFEQVVMLQGFPCIRRKASGKDSLASF